MKSETVPLAMPVDLLQEARRLAKATNLSVADVMRQGMKLGFPQLERHFSPLDGLKPMTREEIRQCWEVPNPEFDALEHHCAQLPQPVPEED